MSLAAICDIIILIAAVCVALANIYKFFANGGKKVKDKIDETRAEQLQAEKTRTREVIAEVSTEQEATRKAEIVSVLREELPAMLVDHDIKLREKYKADREQYLQDIKEAVVQEIETQLNAVDSIQGDM